MREGKYVETENSEQTVNTTTVQHVPIKALAQRTCRWGKSRFHHKSHFNCNAGFNIYGLFSQQTHSPVSSSVIGFTQSQLRW